MVHDTLTPGTVLRSHGGHGRAVAVITRLTDERVYLQHKTGPAFDLPRWYLSSPVCGWRLAKKRLRPTRARS